MNHEPIRCFEGSAKPYEPFWRLVNAAESESGDPEIELYGPISEYSWWGDEVTPALFKADLYRLGKNGPVTVRINSGGGEIFAASVIRSILMDYPGKVTTRIDGLCASAATYVATAGDIVKMQDSAFFMIHDPSMVMWGTLEDFKKAVDMLKTIKEGIIEQYQSKSHLDAEKLSKLMTDETWMSAQEAKEYGFVDEIITAPSKTADLLESTAVVNALNSYGNLPEALRKLMKKAEENRKNAPVVSNPVADRLRAEAKLLV